jgi:hypothetical protein
MRKYIGISFRKMQGSDGGQYLTWTIWYPRSRSRLGYLYGSLKVSHG